ncbi:MAG: hypothetical protein P9X24_13980 [Candidatus Hatepunaea meridiana]|nr:hypothetical protein [Candidatus Hatepunaea meridiana]
MLHRFNTKTAALITLFSYLLIFPSIGTTDEKPIKMTTQDMIYLLFTAEESVTDYIIDELTTYPADSLISWITNFSNYSLPEVTGKPTRRLHKINNSLEAPYYIYIPTSYDPTQSTPLMIWLHGGVSRPEFPDEDSEIGDHPIFTVCEESGMLLLFPLAKMGCLWWDDTGIANILWQVREMKMQFNVDDDKVFIGGFSDGASGAFHLAMLAPTDFAVFFPWSGYIPVGSLVGKMPVYVPNLQCRPIFASNGGKDRLYPISRVEPFIRMAKEHSSEFNFIAYDSAGHNYEHLKYEWPLFKERTKSFIRKPLKPQLYWETSDLKYNQLDWLEITELDSTQIAKDWHKDINHRLTDDRVTIGFNTDREWEGEGVMVATVMQDSALPACKIGLQKGDIVIGLDDIFFKDIKGLSEAKSTKKRGEAFSMTIKRSENTMTFHSDFPPSTEYDAFARKNPSGAVKATRIGNRFEIETSRVGAFRIKIHPNMIRMDQPVVVSVNGKDASKISIIPDTKFMLENFIKNRDKRLLWVYAIDINIQ